MQDFPETAYRTQLERGFRWLRFERTLELEFRDARLADVRLRVIICLVLVAAMVSLFFSSASDPAVTSPRGIRAVILLCATAAIGVSVLTTDLFTRYWLRVGPLGLIAIGVLATSAVANRVAGGHEEDYALLVPAFLLLFITLGLLFWEALATGVALLASYVYALAVVAPAPATFHFETLLLGLATLLGAVLAYLDDSSTRTLFLQTRLLEDATYRDKLTSLANRRAFDRHLELLWKQGQRAEAPIAVLLVDVDNFKDYNDHYGHQAGDDCLRRLGMALRALSRRPLDMTARLGGDEFASLLYDTTPEHVRHAAEELRRVAHELALPHAPAATHKTVTASVGAALAVPTPPRSAAGLVQLADEALYDAKAKGRDRVEVRIAEYEQLDTGSFRRAKRSELP